MKQYQICIDPMVFIPTSIRNGVALIPFDPENTEYQQFLKDWEAGAEVLNPDGTPAPYVAPEPK
jgi:hypothetical protein